MKHYSLYSTPTSSSDATIFSFFGLKYRSELKFLILDIFVPLYQIEVTVLHLQMLNNNSIEIFKFHWTWAQIFFYIQLQFFMDWSRERKMEQEKRGTRKIRGLIITEQHRNSPEWHISPIYINCQSWTSLLSASTLPASEKKWRNGHL